MKNVSSKYISDIIDFRQSYGEISGKTIGRGEVISMNNEYFEFLTKFNTPKSREEAIDGDPNGETIFNQLLESGCIIELSELFKRKPIEKNRVEYLAIITKNRPETIKKSIYTWDVALKDTDLTFVVVDDSENIQTEEVIKNFIVETGRKVKYINSSDIKRLAEEVDKHTNSNSGSFLLGSSSFGTSRNILLLLLNGASFIMTDDDTYPDFKLHKSSSFEMTFESGYNPIYRHIFHDEDSYNSVLNSFKSEISDYYLKSINGEFSCSDLQNTNSLTLHRFFNPESEIVMVVFSSYGDIGGTNSRYMFVNRDFINSDAFTEENYEKSRDSRLVFRGSLSNSIGENSVITMHTAINNRSLLPPFPPIGRGEDQLWGVLLYLLHKDKRVLNSPLAVYHSPEEKRVLSRDMTLKWKESINETLTLILIDKSLEVRNSEDQYRTLGESLIGLGELDNKEFQKYIQGLKAENNRKKIKKLKEELSKFNKKPSSWTLDIKESIKRIKRSEYSPDLTKEYLANFGKALIQWPQLKAINLEE